MNRYILKNETKEKYIPIITEHIKKIEDNTEESFYDIELDLTDSELNPYTLCKLLEDLGYMKTEIDNNGWDMNYWIYFEKQNYSMLLIRGTGITGEFFLSGCDD